MTSTWIEPVTTTKRITLATVLPSGIGSGELSVRVVDGGEYVELAVMWPEPLVDLQVMHKKWLNADGRDRLLPYHPKYLGFEAALKKL